MFLLSTHVQADYHIIKINIIIHPHINLAKGHATILEQRLHKRARRTFASMQRCKIWVGVVVVIVTVTLFKVMDFFHKKPSLYCRITVKFRV